MDMLSKKIENGDRITPEEALRLFEWDILQLGKAANTRRKRVFPQQEVGFIIDRIINYTNICEVACAFCAFHAKADNAHPYELSTAEILDKVQELVDAGGSQVMLQGGLHPDYTLRTYIRMIRSIKERFPMVYLHSLSPAEVVHISKKSRISIPEVVQALKQAGIDSIPGASDLLVERIRKKISPKKASVQEWCDVVTALHQNRMKSSATMTYGMGETNAEKVEHLKVIRDIQDKTGILRAFIPWSFSPANTRMKNMPPATGLEYLRVVAIARIFLDNITHIQAGWLTEGLKLAQIALAMGANDMGGVLTEEVVVRATGIETRTNEAELKDLIRNAGKIPVQRDSDYHVIKRFD